MESECIPFPRAGQDFETGQGHKDIEICMHHHQSF